MTHAANDQESTSYGWLDTLVIPRRLSKEDYEYPADRIALAVFKALPGAGWIAKKFLNFFLKFDVANLLGSTVRVSATQFSDLHRLIIKVSEVLGLESPPVYLKESPDLQAETFGTDEANVYVVVTRGLIEAARPRELAFVLGHEIGHIRSEHVLYHTIARWLTEKAGEIVGLLSYPAKLALLARHRRAEITADRAGLICCQDLQSAQRALVLISLGSRDLANQVDVGELESQGAKDFGRWAEFVHTHPYLPKRLKGIRLFAGSHFYLRRIVQDEQTPFLTPEDLDAAMGKVFGDEDIGDPPLSKESSDERRLKVMMAYAAAWNDGKLGERERDTINSLLEELRFDASEREFLSQFANEALDLKSLEVELRYFQGNKIAGLVYAFSLLALETPKFGWRQRGFLERIAKACGIPEKTAHELATNMKQRTEFFVQRCGVHLCVNCSKVYPVGHQHCPACGVLSQSLARLTLDEDRRVCGRCGVIFRKNDFYCCPKCGSKGVLAVRKAELVE